MGEGTKSKWRLLTGAILLICANFSAFGCDGMDVQSTEEKNQQLKVSEEAFRKNPKDKSALAKIIEMLKDRNGVARSNAAATLGDLAEAGLARDMRDAVPPLVELLKNADDFGKKASACALKNFGAVAKDAIQDLRRNLQPSDHDTAWCSAEALGGMGEIAQEAVPDLVKVINDDQASFSIDKTSISRFAIPALGGIGPAARAAIPNLESLLAHPSPYYRILVSVALIQIDPTGQKGLDALAMLLHDKDVEVRRKTIWSLKDIGIRAKPAKNLIRLVYEKDQDADVSAAASDLMLVLEKRASGN